MILKYRICEKTICLIHNYPHTEEEIQIIGNPERIALHNAALLNKDQVAINALQDWYEEHGVTLVLFNE